MADPHFLNLQPGTVVNDRYEIVKCLGTGSMGMVYACRHRELSGHLVAMKVLFAEVARDEVQAARFRNEIVASYGVNHPNVVRAYEYFRDLDLVAFTMEYVGGGDLADRIGADEPMAVDEIRRMLIQMCAGVQAIHNAGIIHRDLKPENILLTSQGDIKITDFGIARMGVGPKLTEHGGVIGTLDYVSPEYLEKGNVDSRSDIYALGVLGYEMITGVVPYRGNNVIEKMTMRLRSEAEPPEKLRADCPSSLSKIVLRALACSPENRYQTASAMMQELSAMKSGEGTVSSSQCSTVPLGSPSQQSSWQVAAANMSSGMSSESSVPGVADLGMLEFASTSVEMPGSDDDIDDGRQFLDVLDSALNETNGGHDNGDVCNLNSADGEPSLEGTVMLQQEDVDRLKEEDKSSFRKVFSGGNDGHSGGGVTYSNGKEDRPYQKLNSLSDMTAGPSVMSPAITVSNPRIPATRLHELSRGVNKIQPGGGSFMKDLILYMFVALIGLGVGLFFFDEYISSNLTQSYESSIRNFD